jgi:threonine dehydrogenase-like Zn-dependent dehydrogenase
MSEAISSLPMLSAHEPHPGNGASVLKTGKAAVLVEPNRLEIWDVPVAEAKAGEVLLRVEIGGVCGSDLHIVSGSAGTMPFPIILGHEGIGRIEQLGAGIDRDYAGMPVKPGDLVYWVPYAPCHRCYTCTVREETPCENSQFFEHAERPNWGSYAEYTWLPNGMPFFRIPDHGLPDAIAALGCALPTMLRGLDRSGPIRCGETVVVQGAGPVGLAAVLVAAQSGARDVIVIDKSPRRLEAAVTLGATGTVSLEWDASERRRAIYDVTGPNGPDLVVEAAGYLPAFPEGIDLMGPHGRYLIMGLWGAIGAQPFSPRDLTIKNASLHGSFFPKPKHYHQAMQIAVDCQDRLNLPGLISHRFAVEQAAEALAALSSGEALKVVISPQT